MIRQPFIYLASPYTHPDKQEQHRRFLEAWKATLWLWRQKLPTFSPIVYTHLLTGLQPPPTKAEYQQFDDRILAASDIVYVLRLPGWDQSEGVRHEQQLAAQLQKPIHYIDMVSNEEGA
jgi:hypothetical protein